MSKDSTAKTLGGVQRFILGCVHAAEVKGEEITAADCMARHAPPLDEHTPEAVSFRRSVRSLVNRGLLTATRKQKAKILKLTEQGRMVVKELAGQLAFFQAEPETGEPD